jgi:hypothetical protein
MRRKWYVQILVILLIVNTLTSCNPIVGSQQVNNGANASAAKQDIIIAEYNREALIKLDMQKGDIYQVLQSLDIEITLDENNGNAGSSIFSEELSLFFNQDKQLKEVYLNAEKGTYKTSKGLQFGDDLDKVLKLYGEQFVKHEEPDVTVYEYKFDNLFFSIGIDANNKVTGWGLSRASAYYN